MKKSTLIGVGSGVAAIVYGQLTKARYSRMMEETIKEAINEAVDRTIVEMKEMTDKEAKEM